MKPAAFAYHRPTTVDGALDLLARLAPDGGRILAGGQSLVPLMALRLAQPAHLIDINRVAFPPLRMEAGALCIPATARHDEIAAAAPPPLGPALRRVAAHVAHGPIRRRGTICGSLAHADPAAEWPLVFATLGGTALARSAASARTVDAAGFTQDVMTTALRDDELLTELRLTTPPSDARLGFYETSRRAGDYATAAAFVLLRFAAGRVAEARIGAGAVERRPRRLPTAEAALLGTAADPAAISAAANAAAAAIEPMEDPQIPAALRRDLLRACIRRAVADALA